MSINCYARVFLWTVRRIAMIVAGFIRDSVVVISVTSMLVLSIRSATF